MNVCSIGRCVRSKAGGKASLPEHYPGVNKDILIASFNDSIAMMHPRLTALPIDTQQFNRLLDSLPAVRVYMFDISSTFKRVKSSIGINGVFSVNVQENCTSHELQDP